MTPVEIYDHLGRRQVITAVALKTAGGTLVATDVTAVTFRPADDDFLRAYVATGEPMDKAGAYGIQGYGAVLVDNVDEQFTGGDSTTDWGALVQAGYLLNPSVELFGRYDIASFDQNQTTDEDTFHEITVGMNYFLGTDGSALHRAKFTVDVSWLPNGSPRAISGIGVLDNNDAGNEIVIRGQFQLLI